MFLFNSVLKAPYLTKKCPLVHGTQTESTASQLVTYSALRLPQRIGTGQRKCTGKKDKKENRSKVKRQSPSISPSAGTKAPGFCPGQEGRGEGGASYVHGQDQHQHG